MVRAAGPAVPDVESLGAVAPEVADAYVASWVTPRSVQTTLDESMELGEGLRQAGAVTSFGLFVTLDSLYVDGLVHITELGGEYYRFDEVKQELRGERTGVRYAVGARVRVQVSRVDLDGRKIDFRLVREGEELLSRALKDKGVPNGPPRGGASAKSAGKRAGKKATADTKSPIQALKSAVRARKIEREPEATLVDRAVKSGVIDDTAARKIREAEKARDDAIQVDEFDPRVAPRQASGPLEAQSSRL